MQMHLDLNIKQSRGDRILRMGSVCPLSYLDMTLVHAEILHDFPICMDGKSVPNREGH
jgi:hypothetical protein